MKKSSIYLLVCTNFILFNLFAQQQNKEEKIQEEQQIIKNLNSELKEAKETNPQFKKLQNQLLQNERKIKQLTQDIEKKSGINIVEQAMRETLESLSQKTGNIMLQMLKLQQKDPEKNKNQIMKLQHKIKILRQNAKSKNGESLEDIEKRLEIIKETNMKQIHQKTKDLQEKQLTIIKKMREVEKKDARIAKLHDAIKKHWHTLIRLQSQ